MNNNFYELMQKQAVFAVDAATELLTMVQSKDISLHHGRISVIESSADKLVHEISSLVEKTFITPIDKEDINDLASNLDDIIDCIESASARIEIYNVSEIHPKMLEVCKKLIDICVKTELAIRSLSNKNDLKKGSNFEQHLVSIHEMENLCDSAYRQAIKELWKNEKNFKDLIAWKDIFSRVEAASDACEHVANVLERIRVKYYA
jgi:predicted phosphate transport protein (TIGR00153 family)